ncbi:MAG: ABC transporter ATP-binding protein [Anaerolineales bacterium]|nr:ABC transporter ATP-binding protein [Anaerolineales bacterium]
MSVIVIKTENLRKEFGSQVAVKGLTLQVDQGEVFGFLGPNGAGKTTSIKMLLGLITPTSGTGTLFGAPLGSRAALERIGFLPEHFRFQEWLTANEFLKLHGELLRMNLFDLNMRREQLLERVGLIEFRDKQLRTFSKGMLQRIGLAQALLNRPSLVLLDEPTSGLDPVGRRLVRDIIYELREEGTSVFLNSHLLSEIEVTCNRVAFIRQGEVVRVMEMSTLGRNSSMVTIRATGLISDVVSGLAQWGSDIRVDGDLLTMSIQNEAVLPEINNYLVARDVRIFGLIPNRLSLEEVFIETLGKVGVQ